MLGKRNKKPRLKWGYYSNVLTLFQKSWSIFVISPFKDILENCFFFTYERMSIFIRRRMNVFCDYSFLGMTPTDMRNWWSKKRIFPLLQWWLRRIFNKDNYWPSMQFFLTKLHFRIRHNIAKIMMGNFLSSVWKKFKIFWSIFNAREGMVEPIYSERFNPIYQALYKNQQKIQNVNLFKISESSNLQNLLIKSIKGESEASSCSVLLKQDFLQFCCCFETLFYLNFPILSLPFYLLIRLIVLWYIDWSNAVIYNSECFG
jgi:hypothetical protein